MTSAIFHHLWQSTLFVLAAWLLTILLRTDSAKVRYRVWLVASLKFFLPFSLLTWLGARIPWAVVQEGYDDTVFVNIARDIGTPLDRLPVTVTQESLSYDATMIVVALWALGAGALLLRWLFVWLRMRATEADATPSTIEVAVTVKLSRSLAEPAVFGIMRPVLLLPEGIAERLTQSELQAILAHELCHVRRRDNLTAAIHMLVQALFWFHPLVWWIGARMVDERERACDESVIEMGNEPRSYAEGVLKVCRYYLESKLLCVTGTSGGNLKQRVEAIMQSRISNRLSGAKKFLLAFSLAGAAAMPLAVGLLSATTSSLRAAEAGSNPVRFDTVNVNFNTASGSRRFLLDNESGFRASSSLRQLIGHAYGVDHLRIYGNQRTLDEGSYDVEATTSEPESVDRMLQSLLAERFDLKVHRETHEVTQWVLTVAPGGHTLVTASPRRVVRLPVGAPQNGSTHLLEAQLGNLAAYLQTRLGMPVVDKTGLAPGYDIRFEAPSADRELPRALAEQLGLRLEQRVAPLDVIVVDSVKPLRAVVAGLSSQ